MEVFVFHTFIIFKGCFVVHVEKGPLAFISVTLICFPSGWFESNFITREWYRMTVLPIPRALWCLKVLLQPVFFYTMPAAAASACYPWNFCFLIKTVDFLDEKRTKRLKEPVHLKTLEHPPISDLWTLAGSWKELSNNFHAQLDTVVSLFLELWLPSEHWNSPTSCQRPVDAFKKWNPPRVRAFFFSAR